MNLADRILTNTANAYAAADTTEPVPGHDYQLVTNEHGVSVVQCDCGREFYGVPRRTPEALIGIHWAELRGTIGTGFVVG